jgi:F0F1-type ATP synthase membrane subunit b/b'
MTSLLMAVFFHGVYDFILMYMSANIHSPFLIIVLLILFTYFIIRLWRIGLKKIENHHAKDHVMIQQNIDSASEAASAENESRTPEM